MNPILHDFSKHFWICLSISVFFAVLAYITIRRKEFWLRLLDAEESFWLRFGLPKGGFGRRFSEGRFCTVSFVALSVVFLLLAAFNAAAYYHFRDKLPQHPTDTEKKQDASDGFSSSKTASKEFAEWEHQQAAQSQVVAYATANTNNVPTIILTVSEFWKGGDDAKSVGITNGMQFPMRWPAGQTLPDGAIMFIPHDTDPSKPFLGGGVMFVQQGHVGELTFKQFKDGLGL